MEFWDAYTRDGEKTDAVLTRGEPIPDGLYHIACHTLVHHRDGSVLLMKRAATKDSYAGRYEASAGGAAVRGDDPISCIRRELFEETGLSCEEFFEIQRIVSDEAHIITYFFVCVVDCDKDSIVLQTGETEGYRWISEEEFVEFIASGEIIASHKECYAPYFRKMNYMK